MAQGLGQARKARLSIPKVNKNPRIGVGQMRRPAGAPRRALANRAVAARPTAATAPAQATAGPAVPTTQSEPTAPLATAAPPTPAPAPQPSAGKFDIPAYAGSGPDPRDATYWANVAKLKFNTEQEYGKSLQEQQRSDTDYGFAVQTALRNRTQGQRTLGENAIRQNLGNSGWLDRNEAEDTTAYTQDRAHAQLNKSEEDQARAAARTALQQGFSLEAASELAAAAGRYAQAQQEAAERAEAIAAANAAAAEGGPAPSGGVSGYTGTGGYIKPWNDGGKKGSGTGSGGTTAPKNNPYKEALKNRSKAR